MPQSLPVLDLITIGAYLVGVLLFGLWMGRRQHDISDYFLGARQLPWWALLLSIVATETSTVTFLSIPGVAFQPGGDLRFLQLTMGYIAGRLAIVVLLLPLYFRGDIFTAYQVLEYRFGGNTKRAASLLFLVTRNLADGLRLFLSAIVLEQILDFDLTLCIIVLGLMTIAYTYVGGMKSVVWNDCIQFGVYMLGALLAGYVLLNQIDGGWAGLLRYADQHDKLRVFDFSFDLTDPYTFWAGIMGGFFLTLGTHGTDQLMVQRYLGAANQRNAARALIASGFVVAAQFALFLLLGVGLAAFYHASPPELPFEQYDRVFATFIVEHLPVGVLGLTLAAVFSAAMSTLSSSLNSSATALVSDFYRPLIANHPSPDHLLRVSRAATLVFGVIQIVVAVLGQFLVQSVVNNVLAIASFATGAVLGVFFLGLATRRTTQSAALIGLLSGLGFVVVVAYTADLAWPWYAVVGSLATLGMGSIAGSFLPRPTDGNTSSRAPEDQH